MYYLAIVTVLAPLIASVVVGLLGPWLGRRAAHGITIGMVGVSFIFSAAILWQFMTGNVFTLNATLYEWGVSDGITFQIGFLIDRLTALMMTVVTFVSLMVHIYTIGYMHDDPGYKRFFSYISLFTFAMLMLVMANNFLQLFFGWEAVGLVSYLLIGFWYTRPSATFASLKAFLVNRVGDFGFLIGIAAILHYTGSLNYGQVFAQAPALADVTTEIIPGQSWSVMTLICLLLMVGAMGKSAQVPLHVWLPDSMEGPTPISALIHAATMVTAGIFMIARMSPLFELSPTALTTIMAIGAITAFFMGLLGVVQNDIKRVIAYSTLSQLGYMFAALGASAYAASMFHLMTHAFFKALLFLGAGSVIIAMHHEQDMRNMGGLRKYMPITYWTTLAGALALIGFPGFSGFFSKDMIIEAVAESHLPGAGPAHWALLLSVFVTALYTFRMIFLTFHGRERMDAHTREHLHETPAVVTLPLVLLAIPSVILGWLTLKALLFGGFFSGAIVVLPEHDVLRELGAHFHGSLAMVIAAFAHPPLYLAALGVFTAWFCYLYRPEVPGRVARRFRMVHEVLVNKYGFDALYIQGLAAGGRGTGRFLWRVVDAGLIDGALVNGTANTIGRAARSVRRVQTGYVYHYAFSMIIGLCLMLAWFVYAR